MTEWTLLRPWWLLALLLPVVFMLWQWKLGPARQSFFRPALLAYLSGEAPSHQQHRHYWLLLPWALAVLALAGPAHREQEKLYQNNEVWIWMLDTSVSMLADDNPPSRLLNARYQLYDLLEQAQGKRIALIAYAGDSYVITPPTDDHQTVRFMLQELEPDVMPVAGSDPVAALRRALDLAGHAPHDQVRLLLITDDLLPAQKQAMLPMLRSADLPLDVLAVGTPAGAPIRQKDGTLLKDRLGQLIIARSHQEELADLVKDTGGRLVRTDASAAELRRLLAPSLTSQARLVSQQTQAFQEEGYWLMLPLLGLIWYFRTGWFFVLLIGLLPHLAPQANAATANELYQQGEYIQAAEAFSDPMWQANAWYRAGQFAKAAEAYRRVGDHAQALYNLGNALVHLEAWTAALDAYDRALQLDPDLADARFNRNLVTDWLRQQSQQQRRQGGSNQNSPAIQTKAETSRLDLVPEDPGNLMRNRLRLQQEKRMHKESSQTW